MTTFTSPDVLRFLGKQFTAAGHIDGHVKAEVTSDLKRRQEGVRIKHRYGDNSVKLYDKANRQYLGAFVGCNRWRERLLQDNFAQGRRRSPENPAGSPVAGSV
jgi:hypothetical protein